jgi:hypothetical protein
MSDVQKIIVPCPARNSSEKVDKLALWCDKQSVGCGLGETYLHFRSILVIHLNLTKSIFGNQNTEDQSELKRVVS